MEDDAGVPFRLVIGYGAEHVWRTDWRSRLRRDARYRATAHDICVSEVKSTGLRSVADPDAVADVEALIDAGVFDDDAVRQLVELFEAEIAANTPSKSNTDAVSFSPVEENWLRVVAVRDVTNLDPSLAGPTAFVLHQLALRHGEYGGARVRSVLAQGRRQRA